MKNLNRYYFHKDGMRMDMAQNPNQRGEWVKFSDIKDILKPTTNNGSMPCQYFRREKICIGENHYHSVPWCNHEPSQRAVP